MGKLAGKLKEAKLDKKERKHPKEPKEKKEEVPEAPPIKDNIQSYVSGVKKRYPTLSVKVISQLESATTKCAAKRALKEHLIKMVS